MGRVVVAGGLPRDGLDREVELVGQAGRALNAEDAVGGWVEVLARHGAGLGAAAVEAVVVLVAAGEPEGAESGQGEARRFVGSGAPPVRLKDGRQQRPEVPAASGWQGWERSGSCPSLTRWGCVAW